MGLPPESNAMSKLLDVLSRWVPPGLAAVFLGVNVTVAAFGGCARWVKVKTPESVQALTGCEPTVSLLEVGFLYDELEMKFRHATIELQDNTDDALAFLAFLEQSGLLFTSSAAKAADAAGLPLLGTALLGSFALLTDRPGTKRRLKAAGERGYAKGKNGDPSP